MGAFDMFGGQQQTEEERSMEMIKKLEREELAAALGGDQDLGDQRTAEERTQDLLKELAGNSGGADWNDGGYGDDESDWGGTGVGDDEWGEDGGAEWGGGGGYDDHDY